MMICTMHDYASTLEVCLMLRMPWDETGPNVMASKRRMLGRPPCGAKRDAAARRGGGSFNLKHLSSPIYTQKHTIPTLAADMPCSRARAPSSHPSMLYGGSALRRAAVRSDLAQLRRKASSMQSIFLSPPRQISSAWFRSSFFLLSQ